MSRSNRSFKTSQWSTHVINCNYQFCWNKLRHFHVGAPDNCLISSSLNPALGTLNVTTKKSITSYTEQISILQFANTFLFVAIIYKGIFENRDIQSLDKKKVLYRKLWHFACQIIFSHYVVFFETFSYSPEAHSHIR